MTGGGNLTRIPISPYVYPPPQFISRDSRAARFACGAQLILRSLRSRGTAHTPLASLAAQSRAVRKSNSLNALNAFSVKAQLKFWLLGFQRTITESGSPFF